jgi:hypothetical protein
MPNEDRRAKRLHRAIARRLRSVAWLRVALAALAYLVYAYINQGRPAGLDYFVPLADAFLHGGLAIPAEPFLNELVPIGDSGLGYVVYPPMPAVLLLPFVAAFGSSLDQAGISILLGATNVFLASGVLARLGLRREVWVVLSLAFAFGSIGWYSAQSGSSWHFAHVSATFFMLLAIRGTQVGWPLWAIGIAYGGAGLSRLPVFLSAPFFVAYLIHRVRTDPGDARPFGWTRRITPLDQIGRFDVSRLVREGLVFSLGTALLLVPFLAYNLARFGSPTEAGYEMIPGLLDEYQYRFGFFSVVNVPRNLYALLLTPPRLVEQAPFLQPALLGGMSILLTTPVFLWAIRARSATWFVVGCWAAVAAILVPVLLHADPGGAQFGYRYAQDFYPFLLLLTAHGIGRTVGFEATLALAIGFVVNAWGMWATTVNWFA